MSNTVENITSIPVTAPYLKGNEKIYLEDCLSSNWITGGKYVKRFEKEFAEFVECKYGVAVCNGTAALHVALLSLGIGAGDEVIIPTLTYIATANAVTYCGAKPIFADCEFNTWNINPHEIESLITDKTKAIIAVHLYGHPCDMDEINAIASKHSLNVIEDAAEAHGAVYRGRKVGRLGRIACYSFFGNKIMTSAEGGMLTTNDESLAYQCRLLRNHGHTEGKRYVHSLIGYNYRMTDLQAAVGVAQLERIEELLAKKRQIAEWYREGLKDLPDITLPIEREEVTNVYWLFTVLFRQEIYPETNVIMDYLAGKGIETRPVFPPVHLQEPYKGGERGDLRISEMIARQGINLPSGCGLTKGDVDRVCSEIKNMATLYWASCV